MNECVAGYGIRVSEFDVSEYVCGHPTYYYTSQEMRRVSLTILKQVLLGPAIICSVVL
jgi:hypothetical protein